MKKVLLLIWKILSVVGCLFFLFCSAAFMPSLGSVMFILCAALLFPMNKWQNILKEKLRLSVVLKILSVVLLFFDGVFLSGDGDASWYLFVGLLNLPLLGIVVYRLFKQEESVEKREVTHEAKTEEQRAAYQAQLRQRQEKAEAKEARKQAEKERKKAEEEKREAEHKAKIKEQRAAYQAQLKQRQEQAEGKEARRKAEKARKEAVEEKRATEHKAKIEEHRSVYRAQLEQRRERAVVSRGTNTKKEKQGIGWPYALIMVAAFVVFCVMYSSQGQPNVHAEDEVIDETIEADANEEPSAEEQPEATDGGSQVEVADFEAMYDTYKGNKLVYEDEYSGKRYIVTAKIIGMSTDGLRNMFGGVTLTMEKKVGDTIVLFFAEFEEEQEDPLKQILVGDTITFEGTSYGSLNFYDCDLILE